MKNDISQKALESFLKLFSANIDIESISDDGVYFGTCSWEDDEDTQDIRWINIYNDKSLNTLIRVCDFIYKNNLNRNDKIVVSEKELKTKLVNDGWNHFEIEIGLDILFSFTVSMYDNNEYADSFIVHF